MSLRNTFSEVHIPERLTVVELISAAINCTCEWAGNRIHYVGGRSVSQHGMH